jgi:hypothetical protein
MSQEWVSLKDILDVFGEVPEGQPITSFVLQPLFKGKSVNTPAFLVAAIKRASVKKRSSASRKTSST